MGPGGNGETSGHPLALISRAVQANDTGSYSTLLRLLRCHTFRTTATRGRLVSALSTNPKVALTVDTNAFPPHVLLVRGTAAIDIVDGVPPEYLAASRKAVGPDQWDSFEAQVRAMYKQMARIKITPLWAKVLDFETRFPTPIEKLIRRTS